MAHNTRGLERREKVERRAARRCEYCRAPQAVTGVRYHLDHIVPESQGGTDDMENLAFATPTSRPMSSGLTSMDSMVGDYLIREKIIGTIILFLTL